MVLIVLHKNVFKHNHITCTQGNGGTNRMEMYISTVSQSYNLTNSPTISSNSCFTPGPHAIYFHQKDSVYELHSRGRVCESCVKEWERGVWGVFKNEGLCNLCSKMYVGEGGCANPVQEQGVYTCNLCSWIRLCVCPRMRMLCVICFQNEGLCPFVHVLHGSNHYIWCVWTLCSR